MLDPMEYQVTRHAATERAFTGKFWDHHEPGIYTCVCCNTPLFRPTPNSIPAAAGPAISKPSIRPM
jgi:peptide-methionine (R)-S-oxide reductase